MLTPRNEKELAKILGNDTDLRKDIHYAIAKADRMIEQEVLDAIRKAIRRNRISLQLLDHGEATRGLKRYYSDIRAAGKFVKMW